MLALSILFLKRNELALVEVALLIAAVLDPLAFGENGREVAGLVDEWDQCWTILRKHYVGLMPSLRLFSLSF